MDAHLVQRQMFVAPFLGALAGFLVNRAHGGEPGWLLVAEMAVGTVLFTLAGACGAIVGQASRVAARRYASVQQESNLEQLIWSEADAYASARARYEDSIIEQLQTQALREELERNRRNTRKLADALTAVVSHVQSRRAVPADEAQIRIRALEAAQHELAARQVELDRKTMREAEEVKSTLLSLSISESQRQRNVVGDGDQSGRLIELEARIRKLSAEIERLSLRQPSTPEEGQASKVAAGGTGDGARIGFLKAMLEANQTLRRRIQEAA